jgi:methylated-DNA-protein-cysteine methyltransferase-like protein
MPQPPFTRRVIDTIRAIPKGTVATYGQVAALAGNRRAARQVSRILHSSSRKHELPWHRVVNREGRISLPLGRGGDRQRTLLEAEGVRFDAAGRIDMNTHQWRPQPSPLH